jgi:hypothetical protein
MTNEKIDQQNEEYKLWLKTLKPGSIVWLQYRDRLSLAQKDRGEIPGYIYHKLICIEGKNDLLDRFKSLIWAEGGGSHECISLLNGRIVDESFNQRQLQEQGFLRYYPKPFIAIPDHWLEPKVISDFYPDSSPEYFQWRQNGYGH